MEKLHARVTPVNSRLIATRISVKDEWGGTSYRLVLTDAGKRCLGYSDLKKSK